MDVLSVLTLSVTPLSDMTVLENVIILLPELVSLGSKTLAPPMPPVERPRMPDVEGASEGGATREDTRKLPVTMTGKRAEGVHHLGGFDCCRYHKRVEEFQKEP